MSENMMYDNYIIGRAKEILQETMRISWSGSTEAERILALYAAEHEKSGMSRQKLA